MRAPKVGESFACVADTGQKHLLPWAPINSRGARDYRVLFEERMVSVGDWALVDALTLLLTAGATKEEIGRGDYGPRAWDLCGAALRVFEAAHASERAGGWFELALWLAQRDEAATEARMAAEKAERSAKKERTNASGRRKGKVALPERRDAPRDAGGVSVDVGSVATEELGHSAIADAERGQDEQQCRGVGDGYGASSPVGGAQTSLFGDAPAPLRLGARARKRDGVSRPA